MTENFIQNFRLIDSDWIVRPRKLEFTAYNVTNFEPEVQLKLYFLNYVFKVYNCVLNYLHNKFWIFCKACKAFCILSLRLKIQSNISHSALQVESVQSMCVLSQDFCLFGTFLFHPKLFRTYLCLIISTQ